MVSKCLINLEVEKAHVDLETNVQDDQLLVETAGLAIHQTLINLLSLQKPKVLAEMAIHALGDQQLEVIAGFSIPQIQIRELVPRTNSFIATRLKFANQGKIAKC